MPEDTTLPVQGGSDGTWGTELNAWLNLEHGSGGTHNPIVVHDGNIVTYDGNIVTWVAD